MKSKKDLWGGAAGDAGWAALVPPAPGDLRIVQAMVNTTAATKGKDEMASPRAAAEWLPRRMRPVVLRRVGQVPQEMVRDGALRQPGQSPGLSPPQAAVAALTHRDEPKAVTRSPSVTTENVEGDDGVPLKPGAHAVAKTGNGAGLLLGSLDEPVIPRIWKRPTPIR